MTVTNPFAGYPPRQAVATSRFDADRYRRAGASDDELDTLRELFDALDPQAQVLAAAYADSASTDDLTALLDRWRADGSPGVDEVEPTFDVVGNSIPKVEQWVDEADGPADELSRAQYVLAVENSRPESDRRSTLLTAMSKVVERSDVLLSGARTDDQGDAQQPAGDQATAGPDTAQPGERPHPSDPTAPPIENAQPGDTDPGAPSQTTEDGTAGEHVDRTSDGQDAQAAGTDSAGTAGS